MKAFNLKLVLLTLTVLLAGSSPLFSQDTTSNKKESYIIVDKDTVPIFVLREFNYKDPDFEREWNRTVYFARRMYTYAKIIDSIVDEHEKELAKIKKLPKKKRRKARKASKALKKLLWKEYAYEIKNLTNVRGDFLTKLVHRETGVTTFDLIKKYKNGSTAFFWNSVLWSFGSTNLKNKFDPKRDWMLKLVVEDIEAGKISTLSRAHQLQELKLREARDKKKKKKK